MIEITSGTIEERIIRILQKTYPITIKEIKKELNISKKVTQRTLQKFQIKGIVKLDILPDKTYIRLLRNDFKFTGRKPQRKFIKHKTKPRKKTSDEYDGIMFN